MGRLFSSLAILLIAAFMVIRPEDVPDNWNPFTPLDLDAPPTFVSRWKVRALDGAACRDSLSRSRAAMAFLADHEHSAACHIRDRTRLSALGVVVAYLDLFLVHRFGAIGTFWRENRLGAELYRRRDGPVIRASQAPVR